MTNKLSLTVRVTMGLAAVMAISLSFAQVPAGDEPPRRRSIELEALNPPVPEDLVLPEQRLVPAEQTVAAWLDPEWSPPRTSWGDPVLKGTWTTDDMRGIAFDRPAVFGTRETLNETEFVDLARRQQAGVEHADNVEEFHRNEWGTRTFGFSSLVVDPPNGRTPELTEAGLARRAAGPAGTFGNDPYNTFEDFSLYDRCIARGVAAGMSAVLYSNGIQIMQSPDTVTISYEMVHETRVISLDDRPFPGNALTQYDGISRGRWEGDTLVIETRGYTDQTSIAGGINSTNMRTTERLRRVDPEMIEYRVTVDDPDTFAAPFTVRAMWTTQPNYTFLEYSCHEGNYAVSGGLAGERQFELDVAEAQRLGLPIPRRSTMVEVYTPAAEDAVIFDINAGE